MKNMKLYNNNNNNNNNNNDNYYNNKNNNNNNNSEYLYRVITSISDKTDINVGPVK